ncbi:MAG: hypothetical protein MZV64_27450 [Ignavibacteriales bacterium]|nr:hypothetical protein [Ignavibacteriales bacterium]
MRINNFLNTNAFFRISKSVEISEKPDSVNAAQKQEIKQSPFAEDIKRWDNNEKIPAKALPKWDMKRIPLKFHIEQSFAHEKILA